MNFVVAIVTSWNTKLVTILLIEAHPCFGCHIVSSRTFHNIDGLDRRSKPLVYNRVHIIHPKPYGCFKWHNWVISHDFRIVQTIKSYALSSLPIVVVPWYLNWSTPIVTLPRHTRVLCVALITIVPRSTIYLLNITKVYIKKYIYVLTVFYKTWKQIEPLIKHKDLKQPIIVIER